MAQELPEYVGQKVAQMAALLALPRLVLGVEQVRDAGQGVDLTPQPSLVDNRSTPLSTWRGETVAFLWLPKWAVGSEIEHTLSCCVVIRGGTTPLHVERGRRSGSIPDWQLWGEVDGAGEPLLFDVSGVHPQRGLHLLGAALALLNRPDEVAASVDSRFRGNDKIGEGIEKKLLDLVGKHGRRQWKLIYSLQCSPSPRMIVYCPLFSVTYEM